MKHYGSLGKAAGTAVLLLSISLQAGCLGKMDIAGGYALRKLPKGVFSEVPVQLQPVFSDIHFDYDSPRVREDAVPALECIATWLKTHKKIQLMIEGHCDERGSNEYNLGLGERRALSVREFLIRQGTNPNRVHTISYGEETPLNPGHDEAAWAQNRRVHFLISR